MEDAAEILGGTVTGQAKGKSITLPMVQAMFRTVCRRALKGDNRALRRIIELMLTLEPAARDKEKEKAAETREAVGPSVRGRPRRNRGGLEKARPQEGQAE